MAQTPAPAAEAPKPTWTFALKGFISMSAAYQTGQFILSEGQQSLASATAASPVHDKDSLTFDVRQSRFNFSVKGPAVLGGATPSGVLELDFMQGFGNGNFGDVSLLNRLRLLYSELDWGNHKLQLGQQNDLIFAMAPTSLSHIAFPLGYFTGNIGWRRPGIFGYHTLKLGDVRLEGAWEVGRSQWADSGACVVSNGTDAIAGSTNCSGVGTAAAGTPGGINMGEASAAPAVEGRVTASYSNIATGWAAAHWNAVDLTGYGAQTGNQATGTRTAHTVQVKAYNGGVKLSYPLPSNMSVTVAGTGFYGYNIYPLTGNFTTGSGPKAGTNYGTFRLGLGGEDIPTWGYWAQAGLNFTKELSLWGFYGQQHIDERKLVRSFGTTAPTSTAYENATTNIMAMYRDGGYGLSVEWIHFDTKYGTGFNGSASAPGDTFASKRTSRADQYMVTANYFF